jgi:hypothetical protein
VDVSGLGWEVRRDGGTVRVDINRATNISEVDVDAIVAEAEAILMNDGVSAIQIDGSALKSPNHRGLVSKLVQALDRLAQRHGKRLMATPI